MTFEVGARCQDPVRKVPGIAFPGIFPVMFENGRAFLHTLEGKAFQHAWRHWPLRRNVEQAQSTVAHLAVRLRDVCPTSRRIENVVRHAAEAQRGIRSRTNAVSGDTTTVRLSAVRP